MTNFQLITVVLLAFLLLVFLWQSVIEKKILDEIKLGGRSFPDERYFELKSKIQLMNISFTLVIFLVGTLGYNSLTVVESDLQEEMLNRFDSLRLDSLAASYSELIQIQIDEYKELTNDYRELSGEIEKTYKDALSLSSRLGYTGLTLYEITIESSASYIEFEKPYKSIPAVFLQTTDGNDVRIKSISTRGVSVKINSPQSSPIKANLLVFEK